MWIDKDFWWGHWQYNNAFVGKQNVDDDYLQWQWYADAIETVKAQLIAWLYIRPTLAKEA